MMASKMSILNATELKKDSAVPLYCYVRDPLEWTMSKVNRVLKKQFY